MDFLTLWSATLFKKTQQCQLGQKCSDRDQPCYDCIRGAQGRELLLLERYSRKGPTLKGNTVA